MPVVVRYRTKPEHSDENQRLVEAVFADLEARRPGGFRYTTIRLEDGNTFVHLVVETAGSTDSLTDVPAFRTFLAGIAERCEEAPVATGGRLVGLYDPALPAFQ
jgi:hypothetical protein